MSPAGLSGASIGDRIELTCQGQEEGTLRVLAVATWDERDAFTESLFLGARAMLDGEDGGGYIAALVAVSLRKERKPSGYRHPLDFLLCELFPDRFRKNCLSFYACAGAELGDIGLSPEEEVHYDNHLQLALEVAKEFASTGERPSWAGFVDRLQASISH